MTPFDEYRAALSAWSDAIDEWHADLVRAKRKLCRFEQLLGLPIGDDRSPGPRKELA
jgi:hypothetical protein